jgi:hypothetical protein
VLTVSESLLRNNQAIGGGGGVAGSGLGGGLFVGVKANNTATATVTDTTIENNQAIGGAGTIQGGDGLGGGVYITGGRTTLTLLSTTVTENQAQGGVGATPGAGVGGGVYNLGLFAADVVTVLRKNHASTSNDDLFGSVTPL